MPIWGVTPGDSPANCRPQDVCVAWDVGQQTQFVGRNLGPALEQAGYDGIKIMILDDTAEFLPSWADTVYRVIQSSMRTLL